MTLSPPERKAGGIDAGKLMPIRGERDQKTPGLAAGIENLERTASKRFGEQTADMREVLGSRLAGMRVVVHVAEGRIGVEKGAPELAKEFLHVIPTRSWPEAWS